MNPILVIPLLAVGLGVVPTPQLPSQSLVSFLLIVVAAILFAMIGKKLGWQTPRSAPGTAATSAQNPAAAGIRDLLFGDAPLNKWCGDGTTTQAPPWNLFVQARDALAAGQRAEATTALQQIIAMPDLESRHYLQAWQSLRELGVMPLAEQAKQVLGVIVEVGMPQGLDILAAYADHSARFFHFSGKAVIWEHPNDSLDEVIDRLMQSAAAVVQQIGPWDKARPAPPSTDHMRLSFLTPSGLHFGQAPINDLSRDPLARDTIATATELMQRLMEMSEAKASA